MFTSQREKWNPHVIALVELDLQKMRLRIVLARDAIRKRMRELEHPGGHRPDRPGVRDAPDN
jgi:hypothetical protein